MTLLQTILALAERNNLPAIWKRIGRSTGGLEFEIGELEVGDSQDLAIVGHYICGDGKARAHDAVKALGRLIHRMDLRNTDVRNRIPGEPSLREPLLADQLNKRFVAEDQKKLAATREHERLVKLANALAARVAFHLGSDDEFQNLNCLSDGALCVEILGLKQTLAELERPSRVVRRRAA